MISVAINGTLHYKSSFIEHIAMVQSNEDARISVFDMSEMRVSQVIQPKRQKQAECGCLLTFLWIFSLQSVQSHNINKVALSRFSVVSIDGCPLGTVYFVHHNDWLSIIKLLVLRVRRPHYSQ